MKELGLEKKFFAVACDGYRESNTKDWNGFGFERAVIRNRTVLLVTPPSYEPTVVLPVVRILRMLGYGVKLRLEYHQGEGLKSIVVVRLSPACSKSYEHMPGHVKKAMSFIGGALSDCRKVISKSGNAFKYTDPSVWAWRVPRMGNGPETTDDQIRRISVFLNSRGVGNYIDPEEEGLKILYVDSQYVYTTLGTFEWTKVVSGTTELGTFVTVNRKRRGKKRRRHFFDKEWYTIEPRELEVTGKGGLS